MPESTDKHFQDNKISINYTNRIGDTLGQFR